MDTLKHLMNNRPVSFTVLVTLVSVGLLLAVKFFGSDPAPLFNWPRLVSLTMITILAFKTLIVFDGSKNTLPTLKLSDWQGKWFLTPLPLCLIALLSLSSANLAGAQFSPMNVTAWLLSNVATGFFEEVLMRGLCFWVLLNAWGNSRKGVFMAAFSQALIFGLAHLGNLYHMPVVDVIAQVIFATLIGIGFAGIVYLSKSLWPAILVHTSINAAGSFNKFLVPGNSGMQSLDVNSYLVVIALFLILSAIPGILYLRAGTSHLTTVSS